MFLKPDRHLVLAATVLTPVACVNLHGTGFDLPDQDAFAVGRGMAVVATADNPSALYFNPAGITQLDGNNVRVGVYGVYLDPSYKAVGGTTTYNVEDKLHAIPQLFYTYSLQDLPLSFGLGFYSPFGLSANWPQDTGFRSVATQGSMNYYTINPVAAYKLPWNLSVAAGLTVNYSYVDLQQGLTPIPNNDLFRFKGDAWAPGYNLGLRWQPIKQLAFGVTYRSSTEMDYSGHTEVMSNGGPLPSLPATSGGASVDYPFPQEVVAGVSYRPTDKWNLEFDAQYTDWDALGNLTIHQSNPSALVPYGSVPLDLDWESSWYFEWGATRYFDCGWHVSAGYIFNENSVPDAHYNPLVADQDRHFFSLGTGYQGKHLAFDIAYQLGYGPDRTVTGAATSAAGQTADGIYGFISHAVAVSVGWHF